MIDFGAGLYSETSEKLIIGIQGDAGSANETACWEFMRRRNLPDAEIRYLITTRKVLQELELGHISLGVFAYKTRRGGQVEETTEALRIFSCNVIDILELEIEHAIFRPKIFTGDEVLHIVSHPQALKDHEQFLSRTFKNAVFETEADTALAARKLKQGLYKPNTLVIAPKICGKIYDLPFYMEDMPTNSGYLTTFYLVRKLAVES